MERKQYFISKDTFEVLQSKTQYQSAPYFTEDYLIAKQYESIFTVERKKILPSHFSAMKDRLYQQKFLGTLGDFGLSRVI